MKKKYKDIFLYALGFVIILLTSSIIVALIHFEIPKGNKEILYIVIGVVVGSFTNVVQYFFGSSSGSKSKTDLIGSNKDLLDSTQ